VDGILNVNKPAGLTSFKVVAAVRRHSGEKRVGHAGTLDPAATGVLPVCIGKATRVVEYLSEADKSYTAVVRLGIATDTYDASGAVTATADPSGITREQVEAALGAFRGRIQQTPPMFSALKSEGRPLYALAREGKTVERKSRAVTIHRFEMTGWDPPDLTLEIDCSKGTYIRSLAHDLGAALGCGAHLKELVRTRVGPFAIEDTVSLEEALEAFEAGDGDTLLAPIDSVLGDMEPVTLTAEEVDAVVKGQVLAREPGEDAGRYRRAYGPEGAFVAVLHRDKESGLWRPRKVFV
jgi:tRNA pseudouridine55 synthase